MLKRVIAGMVDVPSGGTAFDPAAPGVIGGTTPDVVNTTELNVKDSGGTTKASIDGVAGTASFLNGALVITNSPNNQVNASNVMLFIDTVFAGNGLWIYDGVNTLASLDYDGTAQFKTGAITLGKNTGTAAYIDENGNASFSNGQTTVNAGNVYSDQFTADATVTIGNNSVAGTLTIKDSSGTTTASISGADGSASFGSGNLTIDQYGNLNSASNIVATYEVVVGANGYAGTLYIKDSGGTTTASIAGADGFASFANGAITIGANTGTAVWLDDDGTAMFGSVSTGTLTLTGTLIGGTQLLTTSGGAGAVNLTTLTTEVETTGTLDALTLANGTVGQIKVITHTVGAFTSVLTPTTALGFTSITFLSSLGQTCTLEYTTAGWVILAVGGLTLPVVA